MSSPNTTNSTNIRSEKLVLTYLEVVVIKLQGITGPRTIKTASNPVASAKGMGTAEAHNSAIIKAQPVEYLTEMGSALGSIRETAVGRTVGAIRGIQTTKSMRDLGTARELYSTGTGVSPDIGD